MTLQDIKTMAETLIRAHGLHDWSFTFDNAKRRLGVCRYDRRVIGLSRHYAASHCDAEGIVLVQDTLLHEIAHALVGRGHGHGPVWQAMCRKIGAKPARCKAISEEKMPLGKWAAVCPGCSRTHRKHRLTKLQPDQFRYCLRCGPENGRLEFKQHGTAVSS